MELVVGRVAKSHGIRGELVVDVRTDEPQERFARGTTLLGRLPRGAGERTFTVTAAREHSGRLLLSLGEVTDRSAADALRGTLFLIDSSEVDSGDDPDAFYDHELEALRSRRSTVWPWASSIPSCTCLPTTSWSCAPTPIGRFSYRSSGRSCRR